jgi:hypothetical protein
MATTRFGFVQFLSNRNNNPAGQGGSQMSKPLATPRQGIEESAGPMARSTGHVAKFAEVRGRDEAWLKRWTHFSDHSLELNLHLADFPIELERAALEVIAEDR